MTLLLSLFVVQALRSLAAVAALWQTKEYRLDRMRAHLELPSQRALLAKPLVLAPWGLLALFAAWPALADDRLGRTLLELLYAVAVARLLLDLARRSFHRPRPTPRSLLTLAASTAILVALATTLSQALALPTALLLTDLALPLVMAGVIVTTSPVVALHRLRLVRRAASLVRAHPSLTTIGITGSMGKTSTKEFLAVILRSRFPVVATPEHVNTEIGIAQTILRDLRSRHAVFICEMGAYRLGEIARAAALTRPRLGILTAIRYQHLGLFGSLPALASAKGELLRALPPDGIAIVNADDASCDALAAALPGRMVLRYGRREGNDVRAEAVTVQPRSLQVRLAVGTERADLTVPLLGHQHTSSLLAAVSAAHALGLKLPEIVAAANAIRPLPRTMEPIERQGGPRIVDDSYSANPDGVCAALEYLQHAPERERVVVLASMIELGPAAIDAHRRVGETLAAVSPDLVVLTSPDFADVISEAYAREHPEIAPRLVLAPSPRRALHHLAPFLHAGVVILLEGRIPERLRRSLLTA